MEGQLIVAFLVGRLIVPVIAARKVQVVWHGIAIITALPAFVAGLGLLWFFQASESRSSMEEAWAGIYLALLLAAIIEVIGLIVFAVVHHNRNGGSDGPGPIGSSETRD